MSNLDFLIKHNRPTQPDVEKKIPTDIHTLLDGRYYSVNNKRVFLHETDVSDNSPKGLAQAIDIPVISDLIYRWAGINVSADLAPEKILFIDTETTGLSIGTGTYAFLVGLGFFNNNRFIIRQYFMTDLSGEAALVRILTDEIRRFDLIVSFNGKSYDIPLLNTRFIFHGS